MLFIGKVFINVTTVHGTSVETIRRCFLHGELCCTRSESPNNRYDNTGSDSVVKSAELKR